jgi:hypothetical protein
MTTSTESLERKIELAVEQVVREHLVSVEAAAAAAVREGVRRATRPAKDRNAGKAGKARRRRAPSRRRSREELAELEQKLYEAVRAHPGETMAVLAEKVGATARELNRPALALRHNGRIRSVGKRQYTRYFPMDE